VGSYLQMKLGLDEKLYKPARVIELKKPGIRCMQQKTNEVIYDGQLMGNLIPYLILDNRVIVVPLC